MTPVVQHIQSLLSASSEQGTELVCLNAAGHWVFDAYLNNLPLDAIQTLVTAHLQLHLEYTILCHQLLEHLNNKKRSQEEIIAECIAALMMAQLLTSIYQRFLNVPREVEGLQTQQAYLKNILIQAGVHFTLEAKDDESLEIAQNSFAWLPRARNVHLYTVEINRYRIILTRAKRFLNLVSIYGTVSLAFQNFVAYLDQYVGFLFVHQSWLFFLPRLLINLTLLIKHTVDNPWLTDDERQLDMVVRLVAQIQRRWVQIANDLLWVVCGLINSFALVGVLAPYAVYLTTFAFFLDALIIGVRTWVELNRLTCLKAEYASLEYKQDDPLYGEWLEYKHYLDDRIAFEQRDLGLALGGAVLVFAAMCCTLPAVLAANASFALIAAGVLILLGIATIVVVKVLDTQRPKSNVESCKDVDLSHYRASDLSRFGLFKPITPLSDALQETKEAEETKAHATEIEMLDYSERVPARG